MLDESTKSDLSALLESFSRKGKPVRKKAPHRYPESSSREFIAKAMFDEVKSSSKLDGVKAHVRSYEAKATEECFESWIVDTHCEIACIGMNPAKACLTFRAATNTEFISVLKQAIPAHHRAFNESNKTWDIHPTELPKLKSILNVWYKEIQVVGIAKPVPATDMDKLMAKLSDDDKKAIYRILARSHHPDVGGNPDTMALINRLFKTQ